MIVKAHIVENISPSSFNGLDVETVSYDVNPIQINSNHILYTKPDVLYGIVEVIKVKLVNDNELIILPEVEESEFFTDFLEEVSDECQKIEKSA